MHDPSGRRPGQPDVSTGGSRRSRGRSSASSLQVVLAIGLLALLVAGTAAGLSGIHWPGATKSAAAGAVRAATGAVARVTSGGSAVFSTSWLGAHPAPNLQISGQADVLIDVDARQVIWQRDAHESRAPASLTKLLTAMVVADLAPMDRTVSVTSATDMYAAQRVEPESTVMGLGAGETLTVRELLYGLFLRSGNDAAETLGAGLVPRDQFIRLMNQKGASLRMADSHFTTPVGLDDADMKTTAYDLAIAAATITTRYPELLAISGAASVRIPQTATHKAFDLVNYNKLVIPGSTYAYEGATGMKTAFTDDAGPCMVATATRGGRRLVAVVMHSDNFFVDATRLLDYGFAQPVGT